MTVTTISSRCMQRHHRDCDGHFAGPDACSCRCHTNGVQAAWAKLTTVDGRIPNEAPDGDASEMLHLDASLDASPTEDDQGTEAYRDISLYAPPESEAASLALDASPDYMGMDLETISDEVRSLSNRFATLHRLTFETAARIGLALKAAKAKVGHGEWLIWLSQEANLSEQTAQRLMRLDTKASLVTDLDPQASIAFALRSIREAETERRLTERVETEPTSAPRPRPVHGLTIQQADILDLPIPDGFADLIVTAPPKGLGLDYADSDDNGGYDLYLDKIEAWVQALRDLADAEYGRLCLSVPIDVLRQGQPQPLAHDWLRVLRVFGGFKYRTTLLWTDHEEACRPHYGTLGSPSAPYAAARAQAVLVVYRGQWERPDVSWPYEEADHKLTTVEHDDWVNGLWRIDRTAEDAVEWTTRNLPIELCRRLVKLFSFPADVVVDPFGSSMTAPIVARKLGREAYGFDVSARNVDLALLRAEGLLG